MIYDAIVIGAGVGGIFSAFKLSRKGKKVLLLEAQPIPGGFATSFRRKGFVFESSLHCVDDLGPDGDTREFLKENDLDLQIEFLELKQFARIIYPEHDFVTNFNHEDFTLFLKSKFPEEALNIDRLFRQITRFCRQFDRFQRLKLPYWLKLIILPLISPSLIITSNLTTEQFISKFVKDKKITAIITDICRFAGLPPSRLSALYFLIILKGYYYSPTAYIKGGFQKLFEAMVDKIRCNGSEARFNTRVEKIRISKDKRLKTVITSKGEEFQARCVISNANAIDTLTRLVDDEKVNQGFRRKLSGLEKSISAFQVYLGLKVPAKNLGMNYFMFSINTTYDHDKNFDYSLRGDYDNCSLELVDHAQIDPGLAPAGKGSILIMTLDSYANWKDLSREEYQAKKEAVARKLIQQAEEYLPGLSENIEVMEIATPMTMERFGLSPEGAIYGFAQTVAQSGINRLDQETSVKGLFLAGAWTRPGHGFHGCFVSGRDAADLALRYLR